MSANQLKNEYFKKYYHGHYLNKTVQCDKCGFMCCKPKIKRHQRSKRCLQTTEFIENKLKTTQ